jgi:hypothetical protein
VTRGVPVGHILVAVEVAALAYQHLSRLTRAQRSRLLALVIRSRGRPGSLSPAERRELLGLVSKLEPRLFLGMTARRLSPVPLPKRLLYGRRGSAARAALSRRV